MDAIRPKFNPDARDRLRRVLHTVMTVCLVFNTLAPTMAYATTAPASPVPVSAGRAESAFSPVLGDSLLPAWMRSNGGTPSLTESAPSFALGDRLLPTWMEDARARMTAEPDNLAGKPGSEGAPAGAGEGELGPGLLPRWFVDPDDVADIPDGSAPNRLLAPSAAGQCTPAADLAMRLTVPPYRVSRSNVNGDVYTVTVTNNGTVSTTEVSLLIDPNAGFYYLGASASATSSKDGSVTVLDPGTGAPDAMVAITTTGVVTKTALEPGETMTFTFKLATDANAESGQLLVVKLQSGSPTPTVCQTAQENVPTVRGNLTVTKSPDVQNAGFGDTVTWTVTLRNTGLGNVYQAILTDTIGPGHSNFSVTPTVSAITLAPNASQSYTVTATIHSCTNLTNTVKAAWTIGNADGTGTQANPVQDNTDVIFQLEAPVVTVQIGPLPDVAYCGAMNTTVPVTVTTTYGAARNLRLNLSAQNVNVTEQSLDWIQTGSVLTYTGGSLPVPSATIRRLPLPCRSPPPICAPPARQLLNLPPSYRTPVCC